jgi:phosphomevalonate kinase
LVLDPVYRGLVLGTDARFYAAVQSVATESLAASSQPPAGQLIHVKAPQFTDARWMYAIQWQIDDNNAVGQTWRLVDVSK